MKRNILTTYLLAACLFVAGATAFAAPFHGWNGRKPLLPPANVEAEPADGHGWLFETKVPPKPGDPDFGPNVDYKTAMVDDIPGGPGRRGYGGWHKAFWSPASDVGMICDCADLFKKTNCSDLFK